MHVYNNLILNYCKIFVKHLIVAILFFKENTENNTKNNIK